MQNLISKNSVIGNLIIVNLFAESLSIKKCY